MDPPSQNNAGPHIKIKGHLKKLNTYCDVHHRPCKYKLTIFFRSQNSTDASDHFKIETAQRGELRDREDPRVVHSSRNSSEFEE